MLSIDEVATLLGVKSRTVTQWMVRSLPTPDPQGRKRLYADDPFPVPDKYMGKSPVWRAERRPEFAEWSARRPGRGAGGGPKKGRSRSGD